MKGNSMLHCRTQFHVFEESPWVMKGVFDMQFGITLKPDISVERILGLTRQAEAGGFEYGCLPAAYAHGGEHAADEAGNAGHESGGSRSDGHVQPVCHPESDFRWQ